MAKTEADLIYVIAGKDTSDVNARCDKLLDTLLEPEQRAFALFKPEQGQASVTEILDELRTLPFLTERKVVLVKDADKFVSNNRELLEKYFDAPSSTGVLVLTVSSWPSNTKLAKKLAKAGKLITVTQPKAWQLPGKLIEYAHDAHGQRLTKEAAELLVELAGDSLAALYSEIDKLSLYAEGRKGITDKDVESLIGHNRMFSTFAVIDAIIAGDVAVAIDRLRTMFATDKSAEYTAVGAFAFHFRRLFGAKAMLDEGASADDIAKRLRIWGNKQGFFSQLKKMNLEQIGGYLQRLAETDYAIKTGRAKPQTAIEQLVLELATG